ncbi:putative receptor-type adenylate cyclase [Trypanosoma vivax]|nr:putative receptor-type adenylate cyclase [Trypanosoma vivax]
MRLFRAMVSFFVSAALLAALSVSATDSTDGRYFGGRHPSNVSILFASHEKGKQSELYQSMLVGMTCALWAERDLIKKGGCITLVSTNTSQSVKDKIRNGVKNCTPLTVVGLFGDEETKEAGDALKDENDIVAMAPFTTSSSVRGWNPNLYFLHAEPVAELKALLRYCLSVLRVQRIGFMYLTGSYFGESEYKEAEKIMNEIGYNFSAVFTMNSSSTLKDNEFENKWEKFAGAKPQATIVLGAATNLTRKFLETLLTDSRTAGTPVLGPMAVQEVITDVWASKWESKAEHVVPGQVLLTGLTPLAKDRDYMAIRKFQSDMDGFQESFRANLSRYADLYTKNDFDGEMMVSGWISGKVLAQALSNPEYRRNRTLFANSLYNQRRYPIDDIVIGVFGGNCSAVAQQGGATCRRNQGGRNVYMKKVMNRTQLQPVKDGFLRCNHADCYSENYKVLSPINALAVNITDDKVASPVLGPLLGTMDELARKTDDVKFMSRFSTKALDGTVSNATQVVEVERSSYIVTAVVGVTTEDLLKNSNTTFIDPITTQPIPNGFKRNVIHLSPTLEQQFAVLNVYFMKYNVTKLQSIVRGNHGDVIHNRLRESLNSMVTLDSKQVAENTDDITTAVTVSDGFVLVMGLKDGDASKIKEKLESEPSLYVIITFFDMATRFNELAEVFTDIDIRKRLLFPISLPHWEDASSSDTVKGYHRLFPNATDRSVLSLLGYANARVLQTLSSRLEKVSESAVADYFYSSGIISVDDMVYGAFKQGCDKFDDGLPTCHSNFGATNITLWSFSRAMDHRVPPLLSGVTPQDHGFMLSSRISQPKIVAMALGALAALLLLALMYYLLRRRRVNDCAPKDPSQPVTLVYTNVEGSVDLWRKYPEAMSDAMMAHHRLIRALIAQHGCYEVNAIGDSFVIASRSPFAAAQLVKDIQLTLLNYDWKMGEIDDTYCEMEEERAEEDAQYEPHSARLDPEVYRELWNGLRVRVGVHAGLCEIHRDDATKGYDYFGDVAELGEVLGTVAYGGQVLLTRSAYMALSTLEREQFDVVELEPMTLCDGLEPVELFQLNAVPGRTFGPLRLAPHDDGRHDDDLVKKKKGPSQRSATYKRLVDFFSTMPLQERWNMLLTLCESWLVTVPKGMTAASEEACTEIIRCLASKLDKVIATNAKNANDDGDLFLQSTGSIETLWKSMRTHSVNFGRRASARNSVFSVNSEDSLNDSCATVEAWWPFAEGS